VAARLVVGVGGLLELEGRVLDADREVGGDAGLQVVQEPRQVAVVEARVVDHHVRREDGESRGDLAGVQVVDPLDETLLRVRAPPIGNRAGGVVHG